MAELLKMALLWELVTLGSELVRKAYEAGDQVVAEQMEQIFRNVLLPLVGKPVAEATEQEQVRVTDTPVRSAPREETGRRDGLSALTAFEKRLLLAISQNPGIVATMLSQASRIYGSAMRETRGALEGKGLIEVTTASGGGKPRIVCRLTPDGKEILRRLTEENGAPLTPEETDRRDGLSAFTVPQKRFLLAVKKNPNVPARGLSKEARVSPGTLTRVRGELVDKGLIEVEISQGRGHRTVCRLTSAGEEIVRRLEEENGAAPSPMGEFLDDGVNSVAAAVAKVSKLTPEGEQHLREGDPRAVPQT